MKPRAILAIAIPSIVALTFGIMTWANYNGLVTESKQVDLKQANILTALNARNSLINQLIVAADAYLDHESDVYEMITDARAAYADAVASGNYDDLVFSDATTSVALTGLLVVVEDTPELQASTVIRDLMATMETQEWTLKNAREAYNTAATDFNTSIELFPRVLFAKMFNYDEPRPLWMMTTGEEITVSFPSSNA
ncbi:MAG TPA: LemA family protein [Bacilli bacterium]|nr:LemA family protein [Bacilli bacterium]